MLLCHQSSFPLSSNSRDRVSFPWNPDAGQRAGEWRPGRLPLVPKQSLLRLASCWLREARFANAQAASPARGGRRIGTGRQSQPPSSHCAPNLSAVMGAGVSVFSVGLYRPGPEHQNRNLLHSEKGPVYRQRAAVVHSWPFRRVAFPGPGQLQLDNVVR